MPGKAVHTARPQMQQDDSDGPAPQASRPQDTDRQCPTLVIPGHPRGRRSTAAAPLERNAAGTPARRLLVTRLGHSQWIGTTHRRSNNQVFLASADLDDDILANGGGRRGF